jgi:SPW repeat
MYNTTRKETITDIAIAVLGVGLFLSPWIIGYRDETNASWDAWWGGFLVATLAMSALSLYAEWKSWVNLALGIWIGLAPWLLGFHSSASASLVHHTIGCAVAWLAAARLWHGLSGRPQATTSRYGMNSRPTLAEETGGKGAASQNNAAVAA